MDIIQVITRELNVEKWQVEAAVKLIDEGCTIPFISRYRKEATGTLNDEQLRNLNERLTYLRNRGSSDTCCGRRPLPPIPPETPYTCHHRQGKRSGTAG